MAMTKMTKPDQTSDSTDQEDSEVLPEQALATLGSDVTSVLAGAMAQPNDGATFDAVMHNTPQLTFASRSILDFTPLADYRESVLFTPTVNEARKRRRSSFNDSTASKQASTLVSQSSQPSLSDMADVRASKVPRLAGSLSVPSLMPQDTESPVDKPLSETFVHKIDAQASTPSIQLNVEEDVSYTPSNQFLCERQANAVPCPPASASEESVILRRIFEDESVGLEIAGFLKSSDLRCLIYVLQTLQYPVAGYFEILCRRSIPSPDLASLVNEYIGTQSGDIDDDDNSEVEFVRASFKSAVIVEHVWDTPVQRAKCLPPYKIIYEVEIFGRFCDECGSVLQTPRKFSSDIVHLSADGHLMEQPIKVENTTEMQNEVSVVGGVDSQQLLLKDSFSLSQSLLPVEAKQQQSLLRQIDRSKTRPVLCSECEFKFISRDQIEYVVNEVQKSSSILLQCRLIKENLEVTFDHGGQLLSCQLWKDISETFLNAKKDFIESLRKDFPNRLMKRYGQSFYYSFLQNILPPADFLRRFEKGRFVNEAKYLKNGSPNKRKVSRFKNGPLLEKYPLCSVEKSLAMNIKNDFVTWATSTDITELGNAEISMMQHFGVAAAILAHSNYSEAQKCVDEYILTRNVDRTKLDLMFLSSMWRVLHRGKTKEKRYFAGSFVDRQRVDKYFAPSMVGKQPLLHITGYLGHNASKATTSKAPPPSQEKSLESVEVDLPRSVPVENVSALDRLKAAVKKAGGSSDINSLAALKKYSLRTRGI